MSVAKVALVTFAAFSTWLWLVTILKVGPPPFGVPAAEFEALPEEARAAASAVGSANLLQIHSIEANRYATGDGVLVAVLDTGLDVAHPHFEGVAVTTYNVLDGSADVAEVCEHGTAIAGIVHDVAPQADILAVKIFADEGGCRGRWDVMAAGILYAVGQGARVIVITSGGLSEVDVVRDAVIYAYAHEALVVAAVGNHNNDVPFFPAAYAPVIAVAGVEADDTRYARGNFGAYVDLAAPASRVPVPRRGGYALMSGTSAAAPHVAGVAALLLELDPGMPVDALVAVLAESAVDLGEPGRDDAFGHGRIDAMAAVVQVLQAQGLGANLWFHWMVWAGRAGK